MTTDKRRPCIKSCWPRSLLSRAGRAAMRQQPRAFGVHNNCRGKNRKFAHDKKTKNPKKKTHLLGDPFPAGFRRHNSFAPVRGPGQLPKPKVVYTPHFRVQSCQTLKLPSAISQEKKFHECQIEFTIRGIDRTRFQRGLPEFQAPEVPEIREENFCKSERFARPCFQTQASSKFWLPAFLENSYRWKGSMALADFGKCIRGFKTQGTFSWQGNWAIRKILRIFTGVWNWQSATMTDRCASWLRFRQFSYCFIRLFPLKPLPPSFSTAMVARSCRWKKNYGIFEGVKRFAGK